MWFFAQIETTGKVIEKLADQSYNQPPDWVLAVCAIGATMGIAVLVMRSLNQEAKKDKANAELNQQLVNMATATAQSVATVAANYKSVCDNYERSIRENNGLLDDMKTLIESDVRATNKAGEASSLLAQKISDLNGDIKAMARTIDNVMNRRRGPSS
jgi:uncharacterized membrane protein